MAKKKAVKKAARPAKSKTKASASAKVARKVIKKKPVAKAVARKKPASKPATSKPAAKPVKALAKPVARPAPNPVAKTPAKARTRPETEVITPEVLDEARKKGVRKATLTSGIREDETARKLGRSRIPVDAPLEVVFQNDTQAREAFMFLGISSIRDLEHFTPDELVLRLTGPAKLTVGRIRKILAMNNRCLSNDESFALEFQEILNRARE